MDSPHASQNIEIKSEKIDIIEFDEQVFTNGSYFDDHSQELQDDSYNGNIDAVDDQVIIKEEIICKEEPEFYDVTNARTISEAQMMLTVKAEEDQRMDSIVSTFDDAYTSASSSKSRTNATPITRINKGKPRIYECYICKYPTSTIHSLRTHFTQHIENIVYKCRHCAATFKRLWYYSRHMSQEHSKHGQTSTCTYCNRTFMCETRRKNHERIHTGKKPWCCSVCQKRFNTKSSFELHKKIHTGEKPHQCNQCSLRFRLKHQLHSHHKAHAKQNFGMNNDANDDKSNQLIQHELLSMDPAYGHLIDARTYQCYLCGFSGNQNQLKIHMRVQHTGEKLFNCKMCKKIFLRYHSIDLHMLTHLKNCKFECDVCGEKFRRKEGLKMHMQAKHSQQTAFQCKVCMKKFYKKFTFVTHLRTHTGIKPFQCDFCSKAFVKKSDMVRHTRTHTGERPHKCTVCKMTFTRNHSLTEHKRNIHGNVA